MQQIVQCSDIMDFIKRSSFTKKMIRSTTSGFFFLALLLGCIHVSILCCMLDLAIFFKEYIPFLLILIVFLFLIFFKILLVSIDYEIRSSCDQKSYVYFTGNCFVYCVTILLIDLKLSLYLNRSRTVYIRGHTIQNN